MTDPVTPAAAPAAPAASAAPAPSLVDGAAPPVAAAPAAPAAPATAPAPAAGTPKWYLAEKIGGEGDPPDWYKGEKYKSVAEQAKAYVELEKRFGAFTGSPADGVYKVNIPQGFAGEFDVQHPLFQELNTWAKGSNLSQKGYDEVIGLLARYEASQSPDMAAIKASLGDNADSRISTLNQFAKSNLKDDEYQAFREAQTGANAASVFKAFEALMGKVRAPAMPAPGADVPGAVPSGLAEIDAMQAKRNEKGERLYDVDPKYRRDVEQRRIDFFKNQQAA